MSTPSDQASASGQAKLTKKRQNKAQERHAEKVDKVMSP